MRKVQYFIQIPNIEDFEFRFRDIFRVPGHIYKDNRRWISYRIFFVSKEAASFLASIGVPTGSKVDRPFLVPDWIYHGSDKVKSAYLSGLFDAEGCVYYTTAGKRWRIEIEMYKRESLKHKGKAYFLQLKAMLESLQIPCSPVRFGRKNLRKDGSFSIALKIDIERSSFGNFYKGVGFADKLKAKTLSEVIGSRL